VARNLGRDGCGAITRLNLGDLRSSDLVQPETVALDNFAQISLVSEFSGQFDTEQRNKPSGLALSCRIGLEKARVLSDEVTPLSGLLIDQLGQQTVHY